MLTSKRAFLPATLLAFMTLFLVGCGGPNLMDRIDGFWGYGICGVIIVIMDVIALIEVAGSPRGFGDKVLWFLLIIFFPVGGLILYFLFGRS